MSRGCGWVENNTAAWNNTTPAVILNIQRQPGANTIQVVDSIEHLLPQLESTLRSRCMWRSLPTARRTFGVGEGR